MSASAAATARAAAGQRAGPRSPGSRARARGRTRSPRRPRRAGSPRRAMRRRVGPHRAARGRFDRALTWRGRALTGPAYASPHMNPERHCASRPARRPPSLRPSAAAAAALVVERPRAADPNAKEVSPPGDIPDNQAFVALHAARRAASRSRCPRAGRGRSAGGASSFTDKLNAIRIERAPAAPRADAGQARAVPSCRLGKGFQPARSRRHPQRRTAVRIDLPGPAPPDAGDRQGAAPTPSSATSSSTTAATSILTLSGPKGADNVDPGGSSPTRCGGGDERGARGRAACTASSTPATTRRSPCAASRSRSTPGEMVAVTGPSGSGKSTLLALPRRAWTSPTAGRCAIAGERLSRRPEEERAALRARRIGVLYQQANLVGHLTSPTTSRWRSGSPRRARRDAGAPTCSSAAASPPRASARPAQLSGGELARAGLAVALANDPAVCSPTSPRASSTRPPPSASSSCCAQRADAGAAVLVVTHSARGRRARPTASSACATGGWRRDRAAARALRRRRPHVRRRADARPSRCSRPTARSAPARASRSSGPSGSGKSTLLHLLAGLDDADLGTVTWPAIGDARELRPGPGRRRLPGPEPARRR